jgi:hypothetical protein
VLDAERAASADSIASALAAPLEFRAQKPKFQRDAAAGFVRVGAALRLPAVITPTVPGVDSAHLRRLALASAVDSVIAAVRRGAVVSAGHGTGSFGASASLASLLAAVDDEDDDGDAGDDDDDETQVRAQQQGPHTLLVHSCVDNHTHSHTHSL